MNLCDEYTIAEDGNVATWIVSVVSVNEDGEFYDYGVVDETGL